MKTPRPYLVVFNDPDEDQFMFLGYKTEESATEAVLELLGLDDEDVENLEDYKQRDGWWHLNGIRVQMVRLEFPVD